MTTHHHTPPKVCKRAAAGAAAAHRPHLGSQRDLHRVCQLVHTAKNCITALDPEAHFLGGVATDGLRQQTLRGVVWCAVAAT